MTGAARIAETRGARSRIAAGSVLVMTRPISKNSDHWRSTRVRFPSSLSRHQIFPVRPDLGGWWMVDGGHHCIKADFREILPAGAFECWTLLFRNNFRHSDKSSLRYAGIPACQL